MPNTALLASSWAAVRAPACRMANRPRAPSSPMPVISTPTPNGPANRATEWNNTSTDGRWKCTGASSSSATRQPVAAEPASRTCRPPGAIHTRPGSTGSPARASPTDRWGSSRSNCWAKLAVKAAGMCCTTNTPGNGPFTPCSTRPSAATPPVDKPKATTRCASAGSAAGAATGGTTGAAGPMPPCSKGATCASAAARTAATSSRATSSAGRSSPPAPGLATTATAPWRRACTATARPAWVSAEHITTGSGCCAMTCRKKLSPSMPGMSTSSTTTSGRSCGSSGQASMALAAAATTWQPAWLSVPVR